MIVTKHDAIEHLSNAIAYAKVREETWADNIYVPALEIAVRALANERKRGEWLRINNQNYSPFDCSTEKISVCSVCRCALEQHDFNYCPYCGADMTGETDE